MCLTTEMLAVFLNILPVGMVTSEEGRITVHADAGDTIWIAEGDIWCTDSAAHLALAE